MTCAFYVNLQFFPEANEVKFARESVFGGASFKLDYLTKPSFLEDFGFVSKVKMADRVKPEDEMFLVAYPYYNVNGSLRLPTLFVLILLLFNLIHSFWQHRDACCGRALQ